MNKCSEMPLTGTRQRCASNSVTLEDKTAQHIGSCSPTTFGVSQSADALLNTDFILFFVMVTKLDMVEFSTLKILNSGESGNQTKSGGRNGKHRQQTIHVHSSTRKLVADEYCFNCCQSRPGFSNFSAVLHIHQPCSFFVTDFASRYRHMS